MPEIDAVSYGRRLTQIAADRPDGADLTVVAGDGTETEVTWRTLESRANQIARQFERLGVRPDSIVAVAIPSCVEHILCTLAIWKLGATLLPLRHDQPQWEMDRLLAIGVPVVVVSESHTAPCPVLTRADLAASISLPDGPLDDRISRVMNLGASSGSTGTPKLIVIPFSGVVKSDYQAQYMNPHGGGAVLVTSPLYHVNGFQFASPELLEGRRVVVMEKFDAALAVELIERHHITFCIMVPTMLQRIAQLDSLRPEQLASVETIVVGGAKTPEWVVDRWMELVRPEVFNFVYGSTERLGVVTMGGAEWAEHRGAAGRPQDVELSIRDSDGNPLPAGEVGEIFMRPFDPGRRLFEYLGAPTPHPTEDGFRTIGDLGWLDEQGYLSIADRRTDMIISGGANVYPAEVETALSEHPEVVDQVVVPVPDPDWGHRVHAIVQPRDPANPPSSEALREFCKSRLAAYKAPRSFEFVDRVPRTEAGKLNRTALGRDRVAGGTIVRLVVMGVAGAGKTTVGGRLAERLAAQYVEADSAHPPSNVAKMAAGQPLTDADRWPWLDRLAEELERGNRTVVTCSALKRSYRDLLRRAPGTRFVFLDLDRRTALGRVSSRRGHFMGPEMVASQFDALEPPDDDETDVMIVDATRSLAAIVDDVIAWLGRPVV